MRAAQHHRMRAVDQEEEAHARAARARVARALLGARNARAQVLLSRAPRTISG
mgnify:CR=1 FL=1